MAAIAASRDRIRGATEAPAATLAPSDGESHGRPAKLARHGQAEPLLGGQEGESASAAASMQAAGQVAKEEAPEENVVELETEDEDDQAGGSMEDPILCL